MNNLANESPRIDFEMKEKNGTVQDEARIQQKNDAYNNNNQRQMFQNQEDLKNVEHHCVRQKISYFAVWIN